MQFSQQRKCNQQLFPCPTSWAIMNEFGVVELDDMPHGIILAGHRELRGSLIIIPKEEFYPYWKASFKCRDEPVWCNKVFRGDPSSIALKPGADRQKCRMMKNGIILEDEYTLIDCMDKLKWYWSTKLQIQNACLMPECPGNVNFRHVDCGCKDQRFAKRQNKENENKENNN